jgi:hypothetical protein
MYITMGILTFYTCECMKIQDHKSLITAQIVTFVKSKMIKFSFELNWKKDFRLKMYAE